MSWFNPRIVARLAAVAALAALTARCFQPMYAEKTPGGGPGLREKLSTVEGVLSTSTHFMLRCYKEQGFLLEGGEAQSTRQAVAP